MLEKILKLEGTQEISRQEQKSLNGASGIRNCPGDLYPYSHNGFTGCCAEPISAGEDPCGRTDCLLHVDQCDSPLT